MMINQKIIYLCSTCSHKSSQWLGQCPSCQEWNTIEKELLSKKNNKSQRVNESSLDSPKRIDEITLEVFERIETGIHEFDRVVGGGVSDGSLILIGGEPGVGKSTLVMTVVAKLVLRCDNTSIVYISGEESINQIAGRMLRLKVETKNYYIYTETNWSNIKVQLEKLKPKFLVIDSIQTIFSDEVNAGLGSPSQIREVAYEILSYTKKNKITCFVIGHVTKEGLIAGPKLLEHMVDTVLSFEGETSSKYRTIRVVKNRFGPTDEIGLFEINKWGLTEIADPSWHFSDEKVFAFHGRVDTAIVEGSRPLFVEIQSLVIENKHAAIKRVANGIDSNRLGVLIAIIEKYCQISLTLMDVYLNVVNGIKLSSRDSDLAIIASVLSSYRSIPVNGKFIFLGEVGLTGEVRNNSEIEVILNELNRYKNKKLVCSSGVVKKLNLDKSKQLVQINQISDIEEIMIGS